MLGAGCSHSLVKRPSLPLASPVRVWVPSRQPTLCLAQLTRAACSVHLRCHSARSNWRISRFRDQDRFRYLGPEWQDCCILGNGMPEKCVKHGLNPEVAVRKDWEARFREASHALFKAIGKQWSVP